MRKLNVVVASIVTLSLAAALAPAQSNYKVDPVHSAVLFKINHLGVSNAWGRFNDPQGVVVWDDNDPSKSKDEITLQTAKIDTANQKRDDHLRSPDFFNAKQFPTLSFKSNSIAKKSDTEFDVTGDLTFRGVTKPITVTVTKVGEKETQMGHRAGWETSFTVKRSEFGMTFMPGGVGEEVEIVVSIEGVKQ